MLVEKSRATLGKLGEEYAQKYICENLGWTILDVNWRCRYGEIDIIALDTSSSIVFLEVKTRSSKNFGTGIDAITPVKIAKIRKSAYVWMRNEHPHISHHPCRLDALSLSVRPSWKFNEKVDSTNTTIEHIQGIEL